jgi:hypothetical protein
VADKCQKEKTAFDKAEGLAGEYEEYWDKWERAAVRSEYDAEQELAAINRRCYGKGEKCYIDGWRVYGAMMDGARLNREAAEDARSTWERAIRAAEKAKEKYHRCLDRQKSR